MIVPTASRFKMCVVKVLEVDVEPDLDSTTEIKWVIGRVDYDAYKATLAWEETLLKEVRTGMAIKKRNELIETLGVLKDEKIKTLALSGGTVKTIE